MGLFDFFKRKKEETTQPIGEETGLTFGQEDEKAKEETQREERAEQEPASFAEEENGRSDFTTFCQNRRHHRTKPV